MSKPCQFANCPNKTTKGDLCFYHRPRKPINQRGKKTIEYEEWRDTVARPYLIKTFGNQCAECKGVRCGNKQLDVDHKKKRGSNPHLKMDLKNVQLLGRYPCHFEKDNT
jgi:hypothetical protein